MQAGQPQIGSWSLAAATLTLLTAQLFHPILLFPVQAIGTGTWLALLLAGGIAILLYWPAAAILQRSGAGNLIDLARLAGGVTGEVATAIIITALMVFHGGAVLRETAEMAITASYQHTPQTFAVVALGLCFLYGSAGGTTGIVRLARLFLPGLLFAVLLVLLGTMGWGEVRYLLPIWGKGPDVMAAHTFPLLSSYSPALFLLMAAGPARDRQHLVRAGVIALGGFAVLLAATTVVFLMTFPLPLGDSVAFPLHSMARLVMGGRFLERLDGIWMCVWAFGTAIHLSALLHVAAVAFAGAFGIPSHRLAILPVGVLTLSIAYFPPDLGRVLSEHAASAPLDAAVSFGLPLAVALLARMRIRRRSV